MLPLPGQDAAATDLHADDQGPTDTCDSQFCFVFCHHLSLWPSPQVIPPGEHWHGFMLTFIPSLCCCVPPWGPAVTGVHDDSQGPHDSLWAWIQPYLQSLVCTSRFLCIEPLQLSIRTHSPDFWHWSLVPCAWGKTQQPQRCTQTDRAPRASGEPAVGSNPFCLLWPPPWHASLQLTPDTIQALEMDPECVHTTGPGPHCPLLQSPAAGTESTIEDIKSPVASAAPAVLPKDHGCQCRGPQGPEPKRHSPKTWSHSTSAQWSQVKDCPRMSPPTEECLFLL